MISQCRINQGYTCVDLRPASANTHSTWAREWPCRVQIGEESRADSCARPCFAASCGEGQVDRADLWTPLDSISHRNLWAILWHDCYPVFVARMLSAVYCTIYYWLLVARLFLSGQPTSQPAKPASQPTCSQPASQPANQPAKIMHNISTRTSRVPWLNQD